MYRFNHTYGINRFELKRIRADIVSMIAEAEARGDSAERIFPNGGQNFCDELLKNAVKKRWYEYVLSILNCIAISFAEVFPIVVLGTYIFIPGRRRSRARRYN